MVEVRQTSRSLEFDVLHEAAELIREMWRRCGACGREVPFESEIRERKGFIPMALLGRTVIDNPPAHCTSCG